MSHECKQKLNTYFSVDDLFLVASLAQELAIGIRKRGKAPGFVVRVGVASRRDGCHVELVVESARSNQKLPVGWSCGHVERARIVNHRTPTMLINVGHLAESYVIAYSDADFSISLKKQ